jgi:hypothetical protein
MRLPISLRSIPRNSTTKQDTERKSGRYSKCIFPEVKGYGDTHWVVGCYIELDYPSYLKEMTEKELIQACLDQLNEIPPREKFQRQRTSSLYGTLDILSYKLKEKNDKPFIEMMLITDEQKNEHFWGEGISFANHKKARRRNRKS